MFTAKSPISFILLTPITIKNFGNAMGFFPFFQENPISATITSHNMKSLSENDFHRIRKIIYFNVFLQYL